MAERCHDAQMLPGTSVRGSPSCSRASSRGSQCVRTGVPGCHPVPPHEPRPTSGRDPEQGYLDPGCPSSPAVGTTPHGDRQPHDGHADSPGDVTTEPWIGEQRQGEHHDVKSVTSEGASDGLHHVLVGSDDSTHRLAGIDEGGDLGPTASRRAASSTTTSDRSTSRLTIAADVSPDLTRSRSRPTRPREVITRTSLHHGAMFGNCEEL